MNRKLKYILCGSLFAGALITAQDKKSKKAEDKFVSYSYADAVEIYEDLVDKGYTNEQIYKNLGNASYLTANYNNAANWYGKLFQIEGINIQAEYMYKYAQSLKSKGDYEASDIWMQKFKAAKSGDLRAKKFGDNIDYLEKIKAQSGNYDIKNLAINSSESDFAPSFYGDEIVFSSARDSGLVSREVHEWNNKSFLNLYRTIATEDGEFNSATKLSKALNKKTHESSTAFTKDGTSIYFTRNNSKKGKFSRDVEGVSRLKVYKATLRNGEWINIIDLPFNGNEHSVAHPTLSRDERKLYFASDMEGSYGQSDIFVVDINSDGSFGTPKNLGKQINSEGRETFPFITKENVLYFASDGHPGLGGLDIFATKIEEEENVYIVNLGKPVNSEQDDFSFIINEETKKGFFASNRDGGRGDDDIYGFKETKKLDLGCNTRVSGVVKDKNRGDPLAGAKVSIFNEKGEVIAESVSGNDGRFNLDRNCSAGTSKIVAIKEGFSDGTQTFTTQLNSDTEGLEVLLAQIKKSAPVGTDLAKYLNIEPIYFDFDKWAIRPDAKLSLAEILAYMNEFNNVHVQIGSHTDSRATKAYNMRLSNKRANSTMEYLISKGIDPNRLSALGLGEKMLTNECTDLVICSEDKHQMNRRSEFIVIK